jgi:hypothetical protein
MMHLSLRRAPAFLLLLILALPVPVKAAAANRTLGLRRALESPGAVRSVFFLRGMNCRACTILIDRSLNAQEGIYWARFNYPLRIFVAFHDPKKVGAEDLEQALDQTESLDASLIASTAARGFSLLEGGAAAAWKGGSLSVDDALHVSEPFLKQLEGYMIEKGTEEWKQVLYEISGEKVRGRILRAKAGREGYTPGEGGGELPVVIAKDFYWPADLLPLTAEEAAVARLVKEKVILGNEGEEGRMRFDRWLEELWAEAALDFRGEFLELRE